MLIYNHRFEFIGIDKKDLNKLGFKTFADFQSACHDFADLFVKKPGYIHNFKNLKWILYILNSDIQEAKAILNVNGTTFMTNLVIDTIYMKDSPDEESYIVILQNLHQTNISPEPLVQIDKDTISTEDTIHHEQPLTEAVVEPKILNDNDALDNLNTQTALKPENIDNHTQKSPMLGDYLSPAQPASDNQINQYLYDPKVAADELGLPVDLIEEFIGDFIQQAYDFKDGLYSAVDNEDHETLKNLSHKLKGVAANLRIEDAFEALRIINTSTDTMEIQSNLDIFYSIISKLDKKEQQEKIAQDITTPKKVPAEKDSKLIDDDIYANLLQDEDLASAAEDKDKKQTEPPPKIDKEPINTQSLSPKPRIDMVLNYDKQKIVNELGLEEEIIDTLLHEYKMQLTSFVQETKQAMQSNNLKQVHQLALNIKGTSDNLRLSQISALLEQLMLTHKPQEITDTIKALQQYLAQI